MADNNVQKETNTETTSYDLFLQKLNIFQFGPPSDNLWVIEIKSENETNRNLKQLNENINSVLNWWNTTNRELWKVNFQNQSNTDSSNEKEKMDKYLDNLNDNKIGLFLSQRVNFTPHGVQSVENIFPMFQQYGGFFKGGKIAQSIQSTDKLNINFLITNWDLGDVLFDRWMAAIAQHGLIVDDNNLHATIHLHQYSYELTDEERKEKANKGNMEKSLRERKEYIFHHCYPISRDQVSKTYDSSQAGIFKTFNVSFMYNYYEIKYKL